jgi:sigma-E factor negative regulatory protein RseC
MKEVGIVQKMQGNRAHVSIQRHAACGDCGACHVGRDKMTMNAIAYNGVGAEVGDAVEVEMQFTNVMKASMIAYGIPLVVFILGSVFGFYVLNPMLGAGDNPMPAFLSGLVLTILSYFTIRVLEKKGAFSKGYEPNITAVLEKCD